MVSLSAPKGVSTLGREKSSYPKLSSRNGPTKKDTTGITSSKITYSNHMYNTCT